MSEQGAGGMEQGANWDLQGELSALEANHLRRELRHVSAPQGTRVTVSGRELINFSSNDYLGLANDARLKAAFIEGIERYGVGSGSSRLVCGTLAPHVELERMLAEFKGTMAVLSFSSGFAAAMGTIPALMREGDVIILDKLCHACLVDAAKLSGATIRVFPHNHLEKLDRLLHGAQGKRTLVITESIFSMDGDAAPLADIVSLKDRYGAWLMVDEAHAVGVLGPQGRGLGAGMNIDIQMGTMSKALGLSGGYIAGSRALIDTLINRARSFIYSTAPSPALAHAACEAVRLVSGSVGDALREQLMSNVRIVSEQSRTITQSAILPLIIGDESRAMALSAVLLEQGYLIPAIRYPTVARGTARLRLTLSAAHEPSDLAGLIVALTSSYIGALRFGIGT